jgi:putative hemolysin
MELAIIFVLTLLNGFFALAEIALVSVKKTRMQQLASQGSKRAKIVLGLLENPENFLSSVQVGITLVGIISGAYGGAALTDDLESKLTGIAFLHPYVHEVSLVLVIGGITYFSIVIGELVPKSIAMNHAEAIALTCVPVIKYFTLATYPFVKLLSVSTRLILKVVGIRDSGEEKISEEELLYMLKSAGSQGIIQHEESQVHQNLFSFTDQTARSLMTNSQDIEWLDYSSDKEELFSQLRESVHSKFIVSEGSLDRIKGVITIKDFLENHNKPSFRLDDIISQPVFLTPGTTAFNILNIFKQKKQYIGIVIDEYGGVRGIVTLHDLIEAIVGDLPDEDESDELNIVRREDDTFLINGQTPIYEINQYFQREIIEDKIARYATISGFLLEHHRAIPKAGAVVRYKNLTLEVVDMDRNRIDKVLLTFSS